MRKIMMMVGCVIALCAGYDAHADGFVINLYYVSSTNTLKFDEQATKNVERKTSADTSIVEFSKDTTVGPYILELYNVKGIKFSETQFNKENDKPFQLVIPYFSTAKSLRIVEKSTNAVLLSADLSEFTTCNGNGSCESNLGETKYNCMGDCPADKSAQSNSTDKSAEASSQKSFGQKIIQFFKDLF